MKWDPKVNLKGLGAFSGRCSLRCSLVCLFRLCNQGRSLVTLETWLSKYSRSEFCLLGIQEIMWILCFWSEEMMSCSFSRMSCWNTSAPFYRGVLASFWSSCSGHSGVAGTQVFVLCGQVSFLFIFTVIFPCCFPLPTLDAISYLRIGIRNVLNFIQIVNNFEFFVFCPMCGVSVDIPQRTDEFFEQNLAVLSRGRGKWWIFMSLSFLSVLVKVISWLQSKFWKNSGD